MATYKPLQSISLTSDTTTVTFSGIPQDYTDLEIVISARCSHTGNSNFYYRVNGDTSSSYSVTRLQANGSTVVSNRGSSNTVGYIGYTDAADSSAGLFGNTKIYINSYSNSTTNKTLISKGATPGAGGYAAAVVNLYRGSTSPITSISFTPDAGNWVAGSTFDLYGIKSGAPQALGGDLVTTDGNYWYHTFRSSGTFLLQKPTSVDYLVVAGGGAGGYSVGGGGGAGGLRSTVTASGGTPGTPETALSMAPGSYTVTVGAGGAGTASASALTDGSNSVFATITSTGGGGGGIESGNGRTGGSGGGGSRAAGTAGAGTTSQGRAGGIGTDTGGNSAGGGGGAGAVGGNSSGSVGGTGGAGVAVAISGSSVTYAGGGGGVGVAGGSNGTIGQGGAGGGGASGNNNPTINPTAGTANTGGGGGGGGNAPALVGGNGGSGIVIVRYPV
jgi:hypothetical protein